MSPLSSHVLPFPLKIMTALELFLLPEYTYKYIRTYKFSLLNPFAVAHFVYVVRSDCLGLERLLGGLSQRKTGSPSLKDH